MRAGGRIRDARGARGWGTGGTGGHPLTFQPLDADQQRRRVGARGGQQRACQRQLEQQPWAGRAAHLDQAGVHDVGGAGELGRAHPRALVTHPFELVGRVALQQPLGGGVRDGREHDQVPQAFEQVHGEAARVVPGGDDLVDDGEGG